MQWPWTSLFFTFFRVEVKSNMKELNKSKIQDEADKALLKRCRTAAESLDLSAEVILYGSRARGDAQPDSDYDILILIDGEASLEKEDNFRRRLYSIELEIGAVVTVILVSRNDWNSALYKAMPFYQNIERDGVIL